MNDLAARNSRLEAELSLLASRSQYPVSDSLQSSDEIDLKELWSAIWQGKWLIVGITFIFALGSIFYARSLPNEYRATVLLAPASSSNSSSLGKLAGQFGGLASLAGINLGGAGAEDKSVVAMEIIKTWGFLEKFIEDNNIQVEVFAAKGWDKANNKLVIDSELYDEINKKWVRNFDSGKGQKAEPSSWELFDKIQSRIGISQDKSSGLISLSVEYFSPEIAKLWTDDLVKAINAHVQKQDREEAIKSIAYLNDKIKETNVADMQSVFYQLIEEQTKTLMLAEVSEEYVFKTISPAKVPEQKAKPKRALIVVLGIMLGGMLAVMIVLIQHFRRS
ncbi:LPS O-antigen length regulator [Aliikangiella coralliicola]|uniref:LPS O-antigen length regulator n=2 Tax=Aliikangiella coralliicola TaxID=2592383 RepID=A0A545U0T8_9GAMM|nr:LPS O-antigen length regulator [Aliikangiella coralliicola]